MTGEVRAREAESVTEAGTGGAGTVGAPDAGAGPGGAPGTHAAVVGTPDGDAASHRPGRPLSAPLGVVLGVAVLWTMVGVVWGAMESLTAGLQGESTDLAPAILAALHQSLPWIPGTLAAILLAARFPVDRDTWRRTLPLHLAVVPVFAFGTNVLVVLGFWLRSGSFGGWGTLMVEGARWGLLRIHVAALVYAAVAGLTQVVRTWQRLRARELELARMEGQLARARLQALNAQIRPHFLFNTLHTIGQLWRSGRSDQADAMLDHLGSLFQKVIASTARTEVLLDEELDMVRQYLAIEEARFSDRMRSRITADAPARACLVPPLVLQPLVENAVRHGVSASAAAGMVEVTAAVRDGHLLLVVEDDGPGMNPDLPPRSTGTGLANVRERLERLYGTAADLEVGRRPGGGTRVRLRIPAREGEDG